MALESYLDSSHQGSVPLMAPSRVAGGLSQSSASSGIFFQGDGQSQNVINSHLSSSFGNSANSISGTGRSNLGPVSGDVNQTVLNSVANSGPSVGASSWSLMQTQPSQEVPSCKEVPASTQNPTYDCQHHQCHFHPIILVFLVPL